MNQSYDSIETKYHTTDFSFTLFEATYKSKARKRISGRDDYISFGMANDDDTLTFAGILFADQSPVYQARVFCTRWAGLSKGGPLVDALDSDEFQGNVISLLTDTKKFIRHNSSVRWRKTGDGREEMPDYPEKAVEEAVVNALVHRDYVILGSEVHVDMYDDRVEISSPGGMINGKHIQNCNINHVASKRRNPLICDIMSRLRYMERRGYGLRTITEEYQEGYAPEFYSDDSIFIVTLMNLNYNSAKSVDSIQDNAATIQDTIQDGSSAIQDDLHGESIPIKIIRLCQTPQSRETLMSECGLKNRAYFITNYISPLLESGKLARTIPDKPNSRNQKYITVKKDTTE